MKSFASREKPGKFKYYQKVREFLEKLIIWQVKKRSFVGNYFHTSKSMLILPEYWNKHYTGFPTNQGNF